MSVHKFEQAWLTLFANHGSPNQPRKSESAASTVAGFANVGLVLHRKPSRLTQPPLPPMLVKRGTSSEFIVDSSRNEQ